MNKRHKIGGNLPPDPIDEATAPFADDISEVSDNWLDGDGFIIENDVQERECDALIKSIKAAYKAVVAAEKSATAPLYDKWKSGKAKWKPTIDDLDMMIKGLIKLVGPFKAKKLVDQRRAERAAWEAAKNARREAEAKAEQADAADINAKRDAKAAAEAAREAEKYAQSQSKNKVKGMRTVWKCDIFDERAALHWIARNDKPAMAEFIAEYVRRNHKDTRIDGVKSWPEKEAS